MDAYPILVLAPVAGLVVDVVAHVLSSRITEGNKPVQAIIQGLLAGLVATAFISALSLAALRCPFNDSVALLALNGVAYLALAYGYIGYVGLNLTSLRIHILKLLWKSGGSMPRAAIEGLYGNDSVIDLRIAMLLQDGYLEERQGRLYTGRRTVLYIAHVWDLMRWCVLGRHAPPLPGREPPAQTSGINPR